MKPGTALQHKDGYKVNVVDVRQDGSIRGSFLSPLSNMAEVKEFAVTDFPELVEAMDKAEDIEMEVTESDEETFVGTTFPEVETKEEPTIEDPAEANVCDSCQ